MTKSRLTIIGAILWIAGMAQVLIIDYVPNGKTDILGMDWKTQRKFAGLTILLGVLLIIIGKLKKD